MGIPVLVIGESGSGKSTSLRNFTPEEISIINVSGKKLPFKKKLPVLTTSNYKQIMSALSKGTKKTYCIDDSQYLLAFEMFDKAKETGYSKFTDLALNFYNLIQHVIRNLPEDTIVFFLHHTEQTEGRIKAKTIGKMLDEKLTVEGLFSIVLLAKTDGTRYYFETQSDGFTTAKSPMDMLDREMDNDLKEVDRLIREYWELPLNNNTISDNKEN